MESAPSFEPQSGPPALPDSLFCFDCGRHGPYRFTENQRACQQCKIDLSLNSSGDITEIDVEACRLRKQRKIRRQNELPQRRKVYETLVRISQALDGIKKGVSRLRSQVVDETSILDSFEVIVAALEGFLLALGKAKFHDKLIRPA